MEAPHDSKTQHGLEALRILDSTAAWVRFCGWCDLYDSMRFVRFCATGARRIRRPRGAPPKRPLLGCEERTRRRAISVRLCSATEAPSVRRPCCTEAMVLVAPQWGDFQMERPCEQVLGAPVATVINGKLCGGIDVYS